MVLRSTKFNDVYFSIYDGMAETRHVFIKGNKAEEAWQGQKQFIIAETGFGTGLNFLTTWKAFEETAKANQRLHFISVEKYPLSKDEICDALSVWNKELANYTDRFLSLYPLRVPGPHVIHLTDRVTLTVWFGDIADVVPEWQGFQVDAWYLDGFTPAKNPEMWTDDLYGHMARLSHQQTTFASFTAAGHVRRGLEASGFEVNKTKGFGHKRDMICGQYKNDAPQKQIEEKQSIAIIGGGLSGCAMAYAAHRQGFKVTIYEASDSLAAGASGGKRGMINPKLSAIPTPQSDYYTSAYANALRVAAQLDDIDFDICGSLYLCTDDDKDRRFTGYIDNLGWHEDHICRQGKDIYYPDGACVSPYKLCHALASGVTVKLNTKIDDLNELHEDIIILANSYAVNDFIDDDWSVKPVRGQVSWIKPQSDIDKNYCHDGYITPLTDDGVHMLGSTFLPGNDNKDVTDEDHDFNINKYNEVFDADLTMDDVVGGWAAVRSAAKDRFPIIGHVRDNIYVSAAHSSHGIISGLMAAEIITAQLSGQPVPATQEVLKALLPARFKK